MKEVEVKAHVENVEETRERICSFCGEEKSVNKVDQYFRRKGEVKQALRVRDNNGRGEVTTKFTTKTNGIENNSEYEFHFDYKEIEIVKSFFRALGYEDYFKKVKSGYEWNYDGIHIELFEVNDLGYFLEMEIILPFSSTDEDVMDAEKKLKNYLNKFKVDPVLIESRSYREMILGK